MHFRLFTLPTQVIHRLRPVQSDVRVVTARLLSGGAVSLCFPAWWQQTTECLGASPTATLATSTAVVGAIACGASRLRWRGLRRMAPARVAAGMYFGLAAIALLFPWLLGGVVEFLNHPGVIHVATPIWNASALCLLAAILMSLPTFIVARLPQVLDDATQRRGDAGFPVSNDDYRRANLTWYVMGASAGTVAAGFILGPFWGPTLTTLAAALLCMILGCRALLAVSEDCHAGPAQRTDRGRLPATTSDSVQTAVAFRSIIRYALRGPMVMALAGLLACVLRVIGQLSPVSVYTVSAAGAGLLGGFALARWWETHRAESRNPSPALLATVFAALAALAMLALFRQLVWCHLWLNAYISHTGLLLAARAWLTGLAVAPIAFAFEASNRPPLRREVADNCPTDFCRAARPAFGEALFGLVGFHLTAWLAIPRFGTANCLVALAWGTASLAAVDRMRAAGLPMGWGRRACGALAAVLLVLAPLASANYDPFWSAKTLFTTNVFLAFRNGVSGRLLPHLDEGRPLAAIEGAHGTYTVWRHGGRQLQIRESGIPKGVISSDAEVFPQFSGEILPVAYPLVLHELPQRILLMGVGSGQSLAAAVEFPLREIVCAEGDAGLLQVVRSVVGGETGNSMLADDRVQIVPLDPILALAAEQSRYDVIVSAPGQPGLAHAQPEFTAEFYRRAGRCLTVNGIFCQRVQFIDLGPEPLRTMTRTLQGVFREIMAIELAPGELAFLATNAPQGLIRPQLATRLAAPHVRRLLAQSGFDWTLLLNLAAYQQEDLAAFARESRAAPNTLALGSLAFSLPLEVMRWGPKAVEIQDQLGKRAGRLLNWIGEDGESKELIRRLAELKGQHELMVKFADQYWAYRASIRDEVKGHPQSLIQQASHTSGGGRRLHPEDKHRLQYLTALGQAVKTHAPDDIARLAAFDVPYDPLVSYFMHREAAELLADAAPRNAPQELRHRLHGIFFSAMQNSSVEDVILALDLIREHPQAEPDIARRFDTCNALLQMLQKRWEARTGVTPNSTAEIMQNVDASVVAAERALALLDALGPAAEIPAEAVAARKAALEKTLLRPLEAYRAQILPLHHRSQLKQQAAGSSAQDK